MTNSPIKTKVIKLLIELLFIFVIACVTFPVVFKAPFLPNGYTIQSQQKNHVIIHSYNIVGFEKGVKTIVLPNSNAWKIQEIHNEVQRQKQYFWLLYTAVIVSLTHLVLRLRKREGVFRAFFGSNIIFAVAIPLPEIIDSIKWIHMLIS